jgi:hypothetical protein
MALDVDYLPGMEATFFRAVMRDGVIAVPGPGDEGVVG